MSIAPNRVEHPCEVVAVVDLSESMRRVTIVGDGLKDMAVRHPGQWLKVFFPTPPGTRRHGRAYTIRRQDRTAGTMDMDFVLHGDHGIASRWAGQARVGDMLSVAGPREGYVIDPEAMDHLLVGDLTSLPAIAAIVEWLPGAVRTHVFLEVATDSDRALLPVGQWATTQVFTSGSAIAGTTGRIEQALRDAAFPSSPQVFVAGEATMMRAVRNLLLERHGVRPAAISASGYWRLGVEDHRD